MTEFKQRLLALLIEYNNMTAADDIDVVSRQIAAFVERDEKLLKALHGCLNVMENCHADGCEEYKFANEVLLGISV